MVRAKGARFAVLGLLLALCAACDFDPPQSSELAERSEISGHVTRLLTNERFDELDALADSYRSTKARTPSGLWKLGVFYGSLNKTYPRQDLPEDMWGLLADPVYKWIEHNPRSAAARLAYARILINQAWGIRGTGYANTVEESRWRPFLAKIEEARQYLEEHKSIAASDPYWFQEMAEIATIQQWPDPQFLDLLREAFDREPL